MDPKEQEGSQPKWEGKACASLRGITADQVWPLLSDFFNVHKWFPTLATCYAIHGVSGQPGCVRYCAGSSIPSNSGGDTRPTVSWATERLVHIDPIGRSFTYEIVDSNVGFNSYVSTMKVVPDDEHQLGGCKIEWYFAVDPVQGWKLEDLISKYQTGLQNMANKMEESLMNNPT
ncbi:PREDICTED: lachrymatory-factor synthase-like [Nelumbo nucifera]|uniref:Lachrymatory-factor synthase-like n=2 Tax=Nelumbo nucifera TaxID=4432 RepID=A0A822ZMM6_NELNU|nr:PREDICTED: lachrymatory-factor synthase-like [Nelumbo nucifera]DAD44619.1 TPA_asm: hypothetical protein HUJ06_002849 [Nelumbo nucifera]